MQRICCLCLEVWTFWVSNFNVKRLIYLGLARPMVEIWAVISWDWRDTPRKTWCLMDNNMGFGKKSWSNPLRSSINSPIFAEAFQTVRGDSRCDWRSLLANVRLPVSRSMSLKLVWVGSHLINAKLELRALTCTQNNLWNIRFDLIYTYIYIYTYRHYMQYVCNIYVLLDIVYCIALHCIGLYCIVLHCIVW